MAGAIRAGGCLGGTGGLLAARFGPAFPGLAVLGGASLPAGERSRLGRIISDGAARLPGPGVIPGRRCRNTGKGK